MTVFVPKFVFLLLAHMQAITSEPRLIVQCITLDALLKGFLVIGDWLNACVAAKRVFTVIKGVHFGKAKSKRAARRVIVFIVSITIGTFIHDPIHRRLLNEEEEHRTWCIVRYLSRLNMYNSVVTILHFYYLHSAWAIRGKSASSLQATSSESISSAQTLGYFYWHTCYLDCAAINNFLYPWLHEIETSQLAIYYWLFFTFHLAIFTLYNLRAAFRRIQERIPQNSQSNKSHCCR